MLKHIKNVVLGSVALLGAITFSCSKQQDLVTPAPTAMKLGQTANEDLVSRMAANQIVKDYLDAGDTFANDYMVWLNNLSQEQRSAYKASIDSAAAKGEPIIDPSHTAQEIEAHEAVQAERFATIKITFPDFVSLEEVEFANVLNRVSATIANPSQPQEFTAGVGCAAGLRACSAYCNNNGGGKTCKDACTVGYIICVNSK